MSELPDDLLEEILFRVPATSLNRLRSTCKRWNRLLNDMRFTTKHSDKAPKQFQRIMLKESAGVCLMHIDIDRFTVKGEASLRNPYCTVDQVFHCDGLLLCSTNITTLVVWNPCTGQTRWIQPTDSYRDSYIDSYGPDCTYALGSYQDKRSNGNSYKICRHRQVHDNSDPRDYANNHEFGIYESNSNSWRILDFTIDFEFEGISSGVSLKGKTYWIGSKIESNTETFIVRFDYTTERFEPLCLLPYQYQSYETLSLSVVRDEKLALLLQHRIRDKAEIWVTNKISETKAVLWTKVLVVDFHPLFTRCLGRSFLLDEEKKVVVYCEYGVDRNGTEVYIVGEDNTFRQHSPLRPFLLNYVPSLILPHDIPCCFSGFRF